MRILLVNPPVYDFSCYDYWLKPLGILYIADYLRKNGHDVELFDFMDRHSPFLETVPKDKIYSTGHYRKEHAETPAILKQVERPFFRYGVQNSAFREYLDRGFDYVLCTSGMTYWYPGVKEVIETVKEVSVQTRILLGGIYARLLPEHAQSIGADDVFMHEKKGMREFLKQNGIQTENDFDYEDYLPAYDLYKGNLSAAVMTQTGCVYRCVYCAVPSMYSGMRFFRKEYIMRLFDYLEQLGIKDIMLYDDALLYKKEEHFLPLMEAVAKRQYAFRLHLTNGLHVRYIDSDVVNALKAVNAGRIALSAETVSDELLRSTGNKAEREHIEKAIDLFIEAGFAGKDIYVYLMSGIPGMTIKDIETAADFVHNRGVRVLMNEFSPVPGTAIYNEYADRIEEPLLTGKSAFSSTFIYSPDEVQHIKNIAKQYNRELG